MSEQIKGFRQTKKPTKKVVQSENEKLRQALEGLHAGQKFLGNQFARLAQELSKVSQEIGAVALILRAQKTSQDEKAQIGDFMMVDFSGVLTETNEIFPGSYSLGAVIELGSGRYIKEFEEALIGLSIGDSTEVMVTFPDSYPENLKNKEAKFSIKVINLWRCSEDDKEIKQLQEKRVKILKEKEKQVKKEEEVNKNE